MASFGRSFFVCTALLASVFWSFCSSQDSFYFHPQPQDQNVVEGQPATLTCGVSNWHHMVTYWTLAGESVQNETRRRQVGSDLHIGRVDRHKDAGEFKCIAMNVTTGISISSQAAQLNILWIGDSAKVVLHNGEQSELTPGGELALRCKAEGNPELRVEWVFNGLRLFRNERISFRSRRLYVTNLKPEDNGIYVCRAVNDAGALESLDNFALILPDPRVAKIVTLPTDVTVKRNSTALLDCAYENAATVEWYAHEKDVPLVNSTRFTLFPNGSLLVSSVLNSDQGIYRCVGISATSKEAPQQTYIAHLRVAFIQDMSEDSFEPPVNPNGLTVVPRNSQYEITCVRPEGHPKPHLWWEDPGGHVLSDTGRIKVDQTRLVIDGVKKNDLGNYTCVAENTAGLRRRSINLYVAMPPTVTMHPVNTVVDEGENASLYCEFSGSPYPVTTVQWIKEDKYVRDSTHYTVHPQNGTLIVKNAQLIDGGPYICEVNTTGFSSVRSDTANLIVKEKLKFVPPPTKKRLELGSNAKIYCKARGSTPPVVKWIKDGMHLFDWPPHIRDENGTLHFTGVQNEDAGKYSCIATSSQGIINATIQVDVIVFPKFSVTPVNTEAYEGYPSMLHCQAEGDPQPSIQWDKNGALNSFDAKRFQVLPNGTLVVSETHQEDQGKYGCTAGNSGGFKRAEAMLTVHSAEKFSPDQVGSSVESDGNTMPKTMAITLGAAAVYMLLVLGLLVWCKLRRARRKAAILAQATAEVAKSENGEAEMKDRQHAQENGNVAKSRGSTGGQEGVKSDGDGQSGHSTGSHHSKRSRTSYDRLQFPRHDLQKMMLLGRGEFGEVFLAKGKGIREGETESVVMVKALQSREEQAHLEFKREMDLLHRLSHQNLAKLMGLCRDTEPFFMIIEYSDWGDLKQFLLATRKDHNRKGPRPPPLSLSQIISLCHQVAVGMEFLSNHRFTHKDLAARNCLVSSKLDIKISCPTLSKDTYAPEYHRMHDKAVPLRWAPAEAVFEDEWSTKSDIWAYAVLVWEIFMQAELPFVDKNDEAVLKALKSNELCPEPPNGSPDTLRDLLQRCWHQNPKERPSFSEAALKVGNLTVDSHV